MPAGSPGVSAIIGDLESALAVMVVPRVMAEPPLLQYDSSGAYRQLSFFESVIHESLVA
jgi:hypothetical protein